MEIVKENIGSIIILFVILYFVVKGAVRNGINESILISSEDREEWEEEERERAEREFERIMARKVRRMEEDSNGDDDSPGN